MKLKRRTILILIIAILLCGMAGGLFAYLNKFCRTCSSVGASSFFVKTNNTNLFSEVFVDITNDLSNAKFSIEMVACQSTNDPRLNIANIYISDMSQVRVIVIKRGTLTGWITYFIERKQFFPAVAISYHISGINDECMNGSDYRAFENFQKRIRKNIKKKYDQQNALDLRGL